jgi:hypothetical protein
MRSTKELEFIAANALKISGGLAPFSLMCLDDAEEAWFAARVKGRHGAKAISFVRGKPEDLIPIMDRVRGPWGEGDTPAAPVKHDPRPAKVAAPLTEDGY